MLLKHLDTWCHVSDLLRTIQTIDEWGEEKIDALKSFFCWIRGFLKTSLPSYCNMSCTDYISEEKQTPERPTQFHSFLNASVISEIQYQ